MLVRNDPDFPTSSIAVGFGNPRDTGDDIAILMVELEFEERQSKPFLFFAADKTDPGAYNLPLYLAFADPMNTPGLLLSPDIRQGFTFTIMDVDETEADRVIDLRAPDQLYDIAILLRNTERYVVASVRSNASDEVAAAVSTSRLHSIAGKYTGKDDPVMLVRVQQRFPATGEVLAPRQGFFGAAMLPMNELEYTGIVERLEQLRGGS